MIEKRDWYLQHSLVTHEAPTLHVGIMGLIAGPCALSWVCHHLVPLFFLNKDRSRE